MDFSDQIELGARLAAERGRGRRGRAGEVPRRPARRVPGHLRGPGLDAVAVVLRARPRHRSRAPGDGRRRPEPGDLRLARRLGQQHRQLRRHLPRRVRAAGAAPPHGEPALRPAHPRRRQPARRAPLRPPTTRSRRSRPPTEAGDGEVRVAVHETHADELVALVEQVRAAHTGEDGGRWLDVGVLTRDNAHAEDVFDALTGAGIPVEIVGLKGLLRLPEVAEVVATLHLLHDVTSNAAMLTLLTGPAVGDRSARPAAAQPPGLRARRQERPSRRPDDHRAARRDRRRHRPGRGAGARRRRRRPRRGRLLARGARAVRAARRRAALPARLRGRAAARPGAADHGRQRGRRRAGLRGQPGRRGPPRQPRPVREGGRRLPGRRRRRHPARAAGLPHGRGRPGQRPRPRHPERGRLGQAAHRAPGQGPRVGLGLPRRRLRDPVPVQPVAHPLDVVAVGAAGAAARRRRRPAPARRLRQGRARGLPRRHPHPRRGGGAAPGLRRLHPRGPPALGLVLLLEPARHAVRPVAPTSGWSRAARRVGRSRCPCGARSPTRPSSPTPTPPSTRPGRGRRRVAATRCGCGSRRPSWCGAPTPTPTTTDLDLLAAGRGRHLGRRDRPAARRGPPRPRVVDRGRRCRRACRPPRWPGCATTPRRSPASWPARCRGRRRRQPGSAPGSTPGSRRGSASSRCSTPTRSPAAATPTSPTTPSCTSSSRPSRRARSPTGCRSAVEPAFALVLDGQVVRGRIDAVYREPDGSLPRRRLEDQPQPERRPAPARDLPAGLGRAARRRRSSEVRAGFYYVRSGELVEPPGLPGPSEARGPAPSPTP